MISREVFSNYLKFITNLISLNIAGTAALCALMQTESGKTFNVWFIVATFFVLTISTIAGIAALWFGNNLIGTENPDVNHALFKTPFSISLVGSFVGLLVFLVGVSVNLLSNQRRSDRNNVAVETVVRKIIILPSTDSSLGQIKGISNFEEFDILLLPRMLQRNSCSEKDGG
ncbi:hypothetical protein BH10BDE1_BH10BDE1_23700 [soil metagenome]